jgi:hypothetical protein
MYHHNEVPIGVCQLESLLGGVPMIRRVEGSNWGHFGVN